MSPFIVTTKRPDPERERLMAEMWAIEDAPRDNGLGDMLKADLVARIEQRLDVIGRDALVVVSRRAVATLEEAKTTILDMPGCRWLDAVALINESGGSVGPLPDGTVIEVERLNHEDLCARLSDAESFYSVDWAPGEALAAFNAREAGS